MTDDSVDITYLAAGCAHCGQSLWGLRGTRVSGWDHADPVDRDRLNPGRRLLADLDDDPSAPGAAERHRDDCAFLDSFGQLVGELARGQSACGHKRIDGSVAAGHRRREYPGVRRRLRRG